jgi:transcriptional regulator with XRE-family HTH domain
VNAAGVAFGRRLRDARERKGVTLDAVAASTKIKASLLIGLERGDVSLWPHGIFRRAFIRAYATAIGLPPATVVAEFSRFFPEEGEPPSDASEHDIGGSLRLTLAKDERRVDRAALLRVLAALVDLAGITALAALVNYVASTGFWVTAGVVGLIYQMVMTVWFGRSIAALALQARGRTRASRARKPGKPDAPQPTPDRLQIVSRRGDSLRRAAITESDPAATESAPAIAAGRR